jgi:hypothetical protein
MKRSRRWASGLDTQLVSVRRVRRRREAVPTIRAARSPRYEHMSDDQVEAEVRRLEQQCAAAHGCESLLASRLFDALLGALLSATDELSRRGGCGVLLGAERRAAR